LQARVYVNATSTIEQENRIRPQLRALACIWLQLASDGTRQFPNRRQVVSWATLRVPVRNCKICIKVRQLLAGSEVPDRRHIG
jgi:hypothetical protein